MCIKNALSIYIQLNSFAVAEDTYADTVPKIIHEHENIKT